MIKRNILKIISVMLCFAVLLSCFPFYVTAVTQPDATGDTVKVNFLFAFFRSEPNLSFATIKNFFWYGREVKVLGYSGSYVHVWDSDSKSEGYIHYLLLNDKPLNIRQQYADVYNGATKSNAVTVNYDKDGELKWSVSSSGIVEIIKTGKRSFSVKGISPGTVTLTVECGNDKDTCDISCIEKWAETETSTAQSSITVMGTPGKSYKGAKTIQKGATITARGNIPNNSEYVYVSSGDIWGFIKLSDFSKIKYMMTQYHYYDEGYEKRFGSAESKIYDYADVLNDFMMANFGLKVCTYVKSYTSDADQCKIWRYGSKYLDNLSGSCPKTSPHKTDSCLQTGYLRTELINEFGNGGGKVSKVAWTGHIMTDHKNDRSNATVGMGTVIVTPYKRVKKTSAGYVNESDYTVRRESISTLAHETVHQLGIYDHYCYQNGVTEEDPCSNNGCYLHKGDGIAPDCMMMENKYPTEDKNLLCLSCKSKINDYLSKW